VGVEKLPFRLKDAEFGENGLNASRSRKVSIRCRSKKYPAEQLAELFHHYHQALGPDFGSTRKPNAEAWGRYHNRKRAVWSLLLVWHC
jgi:hypothetical protein